MELKTDIEIRRALETPFQLKDIEWRVQQSGFTAQGKPWAMVLAYVTARAVMARLDDVFGTGGWSDSYEHKNDGVLCMLKCKFQKNHEKFDQYDEWITKQDGSPETAVEAFKGGISKALVRTAVKFGIGRYLYNLDAMFAECSNDKKNGWNKVYDKKAKKAFFWKAPILPAWAMPENNKTVNNKTPDKPKSTIDIIREKLGYLTDNFTDQNSMNDIALDLNISDFSVLKTMNEAGLKSLLDNIYGIYK